MRLRLPTQSPLLSWPELLARLAVNARPWVTMDHGRVTISMTRQESAAMIEALDALTREETHE